MGFIVTNPMAVALRKFLVILKQIALLNGIHAKDLNYFVAKPKK